MANLRSAAACLLGSTLLLVTGAVAGAEAPLPSAAEAQALGPPSAQEVAFYTQPQIKARLRLPKSLQSFAITAITPSAEDAARYDVQVRFKAKTPFGGVTQHQAGFWMKRGRATGVWIVTAQ